MRQTLLLLIALTIVSSTKIVNTNLNEVFSEISGDEFGKTLVETIELQLNSGAAVDQLVDSIREVRDGLRGQLQDGENVHEATSQECASDLSEYNAALTQAQADVGKQTKSMELDTATLASRQEEQANRQAELEQREAMRDNMQTQRDNEKARYQELLEEHRTVGDILAQVRQIIQDRLQSSEDAFLETQTNMFSSLSSKLRSYRIEKKGRAHGYQAIFTLLAQMLDKNTQRHGDQVVVQQILNLVDLVEENLERSLQLERDAEHERENDHKELMDRIGDQIHWCQSQLVELQSTIFTLQSRVQAANERFQNAQASIGDWTQRVQDREAECSAATGVWENFYNNISAELSTCAQVLYLLEDKRALLSRYSTNTELR